MVDTTTILVIMEPLQPMEDSVHIIKDREMASVVMANEIREHMVSAVVHTRMELLLPVPKDNVPM